MVGVCCSGGVVRKGGANRLSIVAATTANGRSLSAGHPMESDAPCVAMVTGLCPGWL